MYDHYFSNFGSPPVPEDKGFSHTNAQGSKLDLAVKRSNINVEQFF